MLCKIVVCSFQVLQFSVLCFFLGKKYFFFGYDSVTYFVTPELWPHPADFFLPEMSKCDWSYVNWSGDVSSESVICRLPMNSVYRWIFLLYWFWLIVTTTVSVCNFFFFVIVAIYFGTCGALCHLLRPNNNNVKPNFGDWMLLLYLKLNMERNKFLEFSSKLKNYQTKMPDGEIHSEV